MVGMVHADFEVGQGNLDVALADARGAEQSAIAIVAVGDRIHEAENAPMHSWCVLRP